MLYTFNRIAKNHNRTSALAMWCQKLLVCFSWTLLGLSTRASDDFVIKATRLPVAVNCDTLFKEENEQRDFIGWYLRPGEWQIYNESSGDYVTDDEKADADGRLVLMPVEGALGQIYRCQRPTSRDSQIETTETSQVIKHEPASKYIDTCVFDGLDNDYGAPIFPIKADQKSFSKTLKCWLFESRYYPTKPDINLKPNAPERFEIDLSNRWTDSKDLTNGPFYPENNFLINDRRPNLEAISRVDMAITVTPKGDEFVDFSSFEVTFSYTNGRNRAEVMAANFSLLRFPPPQNDNEVQMQSTVFGLGYLGEVWSVWRENYPHD